jgi:hypothetical protein
MYQFDEWSLEPLSNDLYKYAILTEMGEFRGGSELTAEELPGMWRTGEGGVPPSGPLISTLPQLSAQSPMWIGVSVGSMTATEENECGDIGGASLISDNSSRQTGL